ncbi:MAG: LysR family transcriptional regulator [Pigmentiphaga sp.]
MSRNPRNGLILQGGGGRSHNPTILPGDGGATAPPGSGVSTPSGIGWDLYRTLLAVLAEGSLSGAARSLGITQPTAGRHIAALESAFGQVLFTRSHEGLRPTETALALREHAAAMRDLAASLEREATRRCELSGTVRLAASEVMAIEVIPRMLAPLRRKYPGLTLELVASNRLQNLLSREADIAVRMASPRQEALIARRVSGIGLGLYAHADYLELHGMPQGPEELANHTLIGFDEELPYLRDYLKRFPFWRREAFSLRAGSDVAQVALIRAACGIGICHTNLAQRDQQLLRVLPQICDVVLDTWVVMHEDLRRNALCKAVFEALVGHLEDYAGKKPA